MYMYYFIWELNIFFFLKVDRKRLRMSIGGKKNINFKMFYFILKYCFFKFLFMMWIIRENRNICLNMKLNNFDLIKKLKNLIFLILCYFVIMIKIY